MSRLSYRTCPKCGADNQGAATECAACGIVYAKWLKAQLKAEAGLPVVPARGRPTTRLGSRSSWLLPWLVVEEVVNPIEFGARGLLWTVLTVWGWFLIQTDFRVTTGLFPELSFYASFLHNVTLAFHEAGHVLFGPLGRFMMVAGGSLFQVLVPAALLFAFVYYYRNAFAGSVALWWLGFSLIDLGPYIYDAKGMNLMLVGGGTGKERGGHDWNYLLTWTDSLDSYEAVATAVDTTGELLMIVAVLWGAYLLKLQFTNLDRR